MNYADCRKAWTVPGGVHAARTLDTTFPGGVCEVHSLADPQRTPVPDEELVARVLTAPNDYDQSLNEILTAKLTNCYANGLSLIRTGAPDTEILSVVNKLMGAAGVQSLVGAVVARADVLRDPDKHFCLYDTDAPGLTKHADIVATFGSGFSNSAWRKEEKRRRKALRDRMSPFLIEASTPADLLQALRDAGL